MTRMAQSVMGSLAVALLGFIGKPSEVGGKGVGVVGGLLAL